ncbi:Trk system potassium transporter TrkA [bacterium (Candidatus Blackallbacteria) CG17_big_fil_post_rev_8_21_14_2_50_48_46]|uniref:Trk system potassium uptake protein TrkA n=1 Tax=bacterium (Candidatus Blackallbacteria) CG17_big_fil_post_rev_8_21_14_2_50_48_46 TaxID=2014261 RepID=A0A2M7G380_9BACT|nr:MAG: Trk system potassium transporter TrkA [bacterium (Candidatus Blackallbacteria) CG18_big_fil_WC_8_21_14_2_50_49_26]PIW16298.1 MAG: Trk system potassium transporter TrkA [bacterium (Candidatus Blackallbacteria) CG17_big_fil_post_rev_8_21_14_2_50_48_46]PIW45312.1 MAG: Trk system potassium transporter TrkA [bacterium (Candidatus Blackallbacteria) CG13_big_fil_rev_8_21_14_2_50_49_14]
MRIVIIGAGEVGRYLAKGLSSEAKDVIIIDRNEQRLITLQEQLDVQTVHGDGSSLDVLRRAGADRADILIAVTDSDEGNMMACVVSRVYFSIPRVIARIRNAEYTAPPILNKLSIDMAISPEKEAAEHIVRLIHTPGASEVLDFEQGKVLLVGYKVDEDSDLLHRPLKDLSGLREASVLLAAILRDERVQIPRGEDQLRVGDTVYAVAPRSQIGYLSKLFHTDGQEVQRVMIIGGSMIGTLLARQLESEGLQVKLIEPSIQRCHILSEALDQTVVLHGDPTHIDFLTEENIEDMDVCVAVSDDEQTNILVSLLAKRLGTRRIICAVTKSEYIPIATSVGIDAVISPRLSAASAMLRFIRAGSVLSVGTLRDSEAEAMEVVAQATSSIVNRPIAELDFPKDAIIAAIIRENQIIIPQGNDMIIPGDRVILFTLAKAVRKVEKSLQIQGGRGTRSLG